MKLKRSGWVNLQSLAYVERFLVFDNIVIIGQACHIPLVSSSLVTTSTWTLPLHPIQVLRSDGATKGPKVLIDFCVGKWQSETQLNVETFLPDGTDQVVYLYNLIATILKAKNGAI